MLETPTRSLASSPSAMPESPVSKPVAFYGADLSPTTFNGHTIETQDDGSALIRGVEVFKSGTFRDSWGDQQTWATEHLRQMVDNYTLLTARGIFPNVPVREDHNRSVANVMGYINDLKLSDDGTKLITDQQITEPDKVAKLARGTYRSVSLEVGMYEDNSGAAYWPVVQGVAYVDIPAVEGLHSRNQKVSVFSRTAEENPVTNTNSTSGNSTLVTPSSNTTFTVADDRGASRPAPHEFTMAGSKTTDYAAVQAHITKLEGDNADLRKVVDEAANQARRDFVKGLVVANKLAAPQEEGMASFAVSLSADQYTAWTATYENAPVMTVLENHGAEGEPNSNPDGGLSVKEQQIVDYQATIETLKRAGMSADKIANSNAAKQLAALTGKN